MLQKLLEDYMKTAKENIEGKQLLREKNINAAGLYGV